MASLLLTRIGFVLTAVVCSSVFGQKNIAVADELGIVDLAPAKVKQIVGAPSAKRVCPAPGAVLRFHLEKGAKRHETSHEGGQCFSVIKRVDDSYKLWIDGVDTAFAAFVRTEDLSPIVSRRLRLNTEAKKSTGKKKSGVFVHAGTPIRISEKSDKFVRVSLPKADVLASGWLPAIALQTISRRPKKGRKARETRVWIRGRSVLLEQPSGEGIARIARQENYVAATQLSVSGEHSLVSYKGEFATVIGWTLTSKIKERVEPDSQTAVGLAKIENTEHWAEAGQRIYDRPYGEKVGVFVRDTELVGAKLKNGWVHFPLATELGTINLWSPLY